MTKHIGDHVKVVLFDHDDTLVGTIAPKWQQHKYVARTHYGKELSDDDIRQHWGKPFTEMICLLYGTEDAEQALAYNKASHQNYPKELFTATIPTLRRLKKAGKLIGIITATIRFSFEHDLELHSIPKDLLDYTQSAEDTPFHKPDPRVFKPVLAWLKEKNITPEEVIYVGDGLHDMKAALGAGFNFIGVETGLVTADEFRAADALSIPSIGHLLKDSAVRMADNNL